MLVFFLLLIMYDVFLRFLAFIFSLCTSDVRWFFEFYIDFVIVVLVCASDRWLFWFKVFV